GEVNLVAEQSFVRMDEVIKNLQESLEDLGQVRHAIWQKCVEEYASKVEGGMPMPMGLQGVPGLDERGGNVDTSVITPELLQGTFRFKPRGSTETADITRQRADFVQFMLGLPMMLQMWPALAQQLGMNQDAARSALEQMLRLFRMPDKQVWLKAPEMQIDPLTGQPIPPMGMMPPGMGGPPGMPGMPPMGGGAIGGPGSPTQAQAPPQGA
ncbi:MAG TPA: hypothetical protein VD994_18310, partial [Prosthecobacter sp.]|nr:hypothetical protein [Prosthecobacter sp.]